MEKLKCLMFSGFFLLVLQKRDESRQNLPNLEAELGRNINLLLPMMCNLGICQVGKVNCSVAKF